MLDEPLLNGNKPLNLMNMKVYVIQFPNPFDEKNLDLDDPLTYLEARRMFFKVFKTAYSIQVPKPHKATKRPGDKKNLDAQAVPEMVKNNIPWLFSRESPEQEITNSDFLKSVISAIILTIQYECNLNYSIIESRNFLQNLRRRSLSQKKSSTNWLPAPVRPSARRNDRRSP
jgi:hypothetical protein